MLTNRSLEVRVLEMFVLTFALFSLGLIHQVPAATMEGTTQQAWKCQFYRLNEPADVFFKSPEVNLYGFWIDGPVPRGLVPTLGTVDRVEEEAGKFADNEGYIFLHMEGVAPSDVQGFEYATYNSTGGWWGTWTQYGTVKGGSYARVNATIWLMIFTSDQASLGAWRVDAKTLTKSGPQTICSASFTVGKYFADMRVDGLPSDIMSGVVLDGQQIGEINGSTSIGLGWRAEHTIVLQDAVLNGSRYHASPSELSISSAGQYHVGYGLQHYLEIKSPYPVNGSGWYNQGETALISAEAEAATGKGSRAVFRGWSGDYTATNPQVSVLMDSPKQISAQYVTQYQLTVNSAVGNPQGSGWYDEGSSATFSVTSPVPVEGLMGTLGGKHTFERWTGDSGATTATASVVMSGRRTVNAEWHTDNTIPYASLAAIAAVAIAIAVLLVRRRKAIT